MIPVNDNTPVAMLTVGQLREALNIHSQNTQPTTSPSSDKFIYGIPGIMKLFNVCRAVAQEYKDTFLQPAVMQTGRKIIVDKEKAMELFAERKGGRK